MLVLGSQRAIYKAIDAFHDRSFRIQLDGELSFATRTGHYRVIDGVCFVAEDGGFAGEASRMIGAELVGWLHESLRASAVAGFWRRGARALFLTKEGAPLVTPATHHLDVHGATAAEGIWTHDRRMIVGHGERPAPGRRPPSVSPPNAWAIAPPQVIEPRSEPLPSFADELFGGSPQRGRRPTWS
ncbi:MAG: hypothetical protein QM820_36835 [Minicystis sp.]